MRNRYKIAALGAALVFLVFLPHNNLLNNIDEALKDKVALSKVFQPEDPKIKEQEAAAERKAKQDALTPELANILSVSYANAISVIDIKHNEEFGVNEDTSFHSASVTKVLVAVAALQGVDSGKYSLNQSLGGATLKYQLQQMINQSNNNSWDLFNNLIGFNGEQKVADSLGLTGVDMNQTHMTTKAVANLLLKIYHGEAISNGSRDLLFSFMQDTETENRITPAIPDNVTFYHKTGSFNGEIHDAAIVLHPKNPFIIVIFTDDGRGTSVSTRLDSFQKATKSVYSYFNSI